MGNTADPRMKNILIFNCGSSSLTCKAFSVDGSDGIVPILSVKAHRVGVRGSAPSFIEYRFSGEREVDRQPVNTHGEAAARVARFVRAKDIQIDYLGHRFAHGGSLFRDSAWLDQEVREGLRRCLPLAPIHNPFSLSVILECDRSFPDLPQYVSFDTAFHADLPPPAYAYALPRKIVDQFGFRKYGFHGLSYQHVVRETSRYLGGGPDGTKIIACHLGTGGASVAAIKDGRSVDTSMGYSPLSGLIMSTRCGDIDPMVTVYLMTIYGYGLDQLEQILNKKSGLLGVSDFSSDIRDLIDRFTGLEAKQARLAFEMYIHRLKKYIGSYGAILGGTDVLVFTDDIGVRNPLVREKVCAGMEWLGIKLDHERNRHGDPGVVFRCGAEDSRVEILVIPPEEELIICREGLKLMGESDDSVI